ncbi:hypothetical protein AMATHDRAFT_143462 [Amanita thiersii Skay4041]|uniref:MINDY deubiquitinase domain-containing protein n=1 Tax=Amanita thiersii Skay4041 TaxID=703135 RepID=A0A2A9NTY5_9AGAR|nr:hypothetical protein AMATHDRAFT_143462 [Amanita thiersii Skay4041]
MTSEVPTVHSSIAEVWYLKDIIFGVGENRRRCKIITQNFNGPCSFIAICNILILRGDLTIEPPERQTVSYEFLSHLVAEYLLTSAPDVDVDASLSVMPNTQKGMDLNPAFTSPTEFHPAGEGKELKLFEQANIRLVHGWLVDPHSPEAEAVAEAQNYDNATILIAEADHLTDGRLVMNEDTSYPQAGSSSGNPNGHARWTEGDRRKVGRAVSLRHFLDATWSQLTYHGLFTLATTLEPGSLVALFRSSHLSVLYKSTDRDDSGGSALYSLVTDSSFLNESSVVWERLDDIDLGSSTFVDSEFIKSSPIGGDFAGHTAEDALAAFGGIEDPNEIYDSLSQALAQQLQAEEDEFARRQQEMHMREKAIRHAEMQALKAEEARVKQEKQLKNRLKHLKKSDCIIM